MWSRTVSSGTRKTGLISILTASAGFQAGACLADSIACFMLTGRSGISGDLFLTGVFRTESDALLYYSFSGAAGSFQPVLIASKTVIGRSRHATTRLW